MSGMRTVVVDKIASVTQACGLSHEIRIANDIPARKASCSWSRSSTTSRPTTRWN
jgi:hypothetical protein